MLLLMMMLLLLLLLVDILSFYCVALVRGQIRIILLLMLMLLLLLLLMVVNKADSIYCTVVSLVVIDGWTC